MASKPAALAKRALVALPIKVWVIAGLAVLLGASALFGGLDDADARTVEISTVQPGEPWVGPHFTTTILDAEFGDRRPGSSIEPDDGKRFLVVRAIVENTWIKSSTLFDHLLELEWLPEDEGERPTLILLADSSFGPQAHPGLPIEVAFVWEIPAERVTDGRDIQVSITDSSLRTDSKLSFGVYWHDPVVVARSEVPVAVLPPFVEEE